MRRFARPVSLLIAFALLPGMSAAYAGSPLFGHRPLQRLLGHRHVPCVPCESEEGFVSLFDGQTLTGWVVPETKIGPGYVVENGSIVCLAQGGGVMRTEKEYANFVLRFEFNVEEGGNNGIGIRIPEVGHASRDGMEIQVLDDYAEKHKTIKEWQVHGSIYGVVPAKRGATRPAGQWNTEEIYANGPHIRVTVNGCVTVDADLTQVKEPADGHPHPGIERTTGFLAFLGHGTRVEFRNLRVKEL